MSEAASIKIITKDELHEAAAKRGKKKRSKTAKERVSEAVDLALELIFEEARPVTDVPAEASEREPVILVVKDSRGTSVLGVVTTMMRDRARFASLVEELMPPEEIFPTAVVEQARGNAAARSAFLTEFPTLTSAEVADLYGSTARNRAALAQSWHKQGKVFAIPAAAGHRFPRFQFTDTGGPRAELSQVLAPLRSAGLEGWQLALWFTGALASLGDRRPVDVIDDEPELVVQAAEHVAEVPQ